MELVCNKCRRIVGIGGIIKEGNGCNIGTYDGYKCDGVFKAKLIPKAEGATTQPTPASEPIKQTRAFTPELWSPNDPIPAGYIEEHLRKVQNRVSSPVPSAGSKPQEERHDKGCPYHPDDTFGRISQPVADGGGLPPLLVAKKMWPDSEIQQQLAVDMWKDSPETTFAGAAFSVIASSQEALRVARERMQQAARKMETVDGRLAIDTRRITEAIKLLSPEGSSR